MILFERRRIRELLGATLLGILVTQKDTSFIVRLVALELLSLKWQSF